MTGDEGSLKGVEQKVHAAEFVIKSYISLRITHFSIHQTQCHPANTEGALWGKRTHHSGARAKGSSIHMTVPCEMSVVAIKPFPFLWSKYSTRRAGPF